MSLYISGAFMVLCLVPSVSAGHVNGRITQSAGEVNIDIIW